MSISPSLLRLTDCHSPAKRRPCRGANVAVSAAQRRVSKTAPLTNSPTRILLVHESPILRLGLAGLFRRVRSFRICGQTDDVREARDLFSRWQPDLVILGLTLRHGDGISLIKDLKTSTAAVRIMVLSQRTDVLSLQRSFRAGAGGYLAAHEALSEFPRALAAVMAGEIYASPLLERLVLQVLAGGGMKPTASEYNLSDRELQVFALIGRGFGATRVAKELHLSVKTVETHRMRIKQKLGLRSGAELNQRAETWLISQTRGRQWTR